MGSSGIWLQNWIQAHLGPNVRKLMGRKLKEAATWQQVKRMLRKQYPKKEARRALNLEGDDLVGGNEPQPSTSNVIRLTRSIPIEDDIEEGPFGSMASPYVMPAEDPLDIRFSAHIQEDIDEFINALERDTALRAGNLDDVRRRMGEHLAHRVRRQVMSRIDRAENWGEVKRILRDEYNWTRRQAQVRDTLEATRQSSNTSVAKHLDRMLPLIDRLRPTVSEADQIRILIRSLRKDLKHIIIAREFRSLRELIDCLLLVERRLRMITLTQQESQPVEEDPE
jgi:hypothetical protein